MRAGVLSDFQIEASASFRDPRRSCFEAVAGRREPCVNCPVLALSRAPSSKRESAVLHAPSGPFRIAFAEALGDGRYLVHNVPVSEGNLAKLQRCRIDRLSHEARLSKREMSVLDLLLLGRSSGEIADALGITERTVRFHVANVLDKLQADSRADLLRLLA
jgi:DNA-binding CsgD family transcriptional regulator